MGHIIVGVVFILGGLTGALVLRGTGSSGALVIVGIGLVVWGILQGNSSSENSNGDIRSAKRKVKPRNGRPKRLKKDDNASAATNENAPRVKRVENIRSRRTR